MTTSGIVVLLLCGLRLVIAVQLTRLAQRPEAHNLLWLALVFYINGFFNLFSLAIFYNPLLFLLGSSLAQIALLRFIHQTFYRGLRSPYPYLLAITLAAAAAALGLCWAGQSSLASVVVGHITTLNWLWHLIPAYRAYQQVAPDRYVEDWVKARYQLMLVYCLFMVGAGAAIILQPALTNAPILALPFLSITGVGVLLQYLAWSMPAWLRHYLNRGYTPPAYASLSDEELLRQANTLLAAQNAELEARVAERTAELEATLNALPDPLFEVDRAGRICDFRTPSRQKLYVSPETFQGQLLREVLPLDAAQVSEAALAEAGLTGHHFGATYSLPMPEGKSWFELSIAAKGDPRLAETHFLVLVHDITRRQRAEETLQIKTAELLTLNTTLQAAEEEQRAANEELAAINTELTASEQALRAKNEELANFNRIMLAREMRNIELKEEINRLSAELGRPAPYPPVWRADTERDPHDA